MKTILVRLGERSYRILIGAGTIEKTGEFLSRFHAGGDIVVITNAAVKRRFGGRLLGSLRRRSFSVRFECIPDSEKSKSLAVVSSLLSALGRYDRKRRLLIVALGGGVVGDVAGFVASVYKRGIPYVHIPTTLLSQIDSSIGGKTGVDLASGKNLVGSFYQPKLVVTDTGVLSTLSLRQVRAGLAEAIKYACIGDYALFRYLEGHIRGLLGREPQALAEVVRRCSAIKSSIVSRDERETKGVRTILNFGHTFGHAIEAASGYTRYNHGEAIAVGMLIASGISVRLGTLSQDSFARIEGLIAQAGLPVGVKGISAAQLFAAFDRDKKFRGGRNRLVLLSAIGKAYVREGVPALCIRQSVMTRLSAHGHRPSV